MGGGESLHFSCILFWVKYLKHFHSNECFIFCFLSWNSVHCSKPFLAYFSLPEVLYPYIPARLVCNNRTHIVLFVDEVLLGGAKIHEAGLNTKVSTLWLKIQWLIKKKFYFNSAIKMITVHHTKSKILWLKAWTHYTC